MKSRQVKIDTLTELLNRREFALQIGRALDSASGSGRHVLCHLDISSFRALDDQWGHRSGDALLCEIAMLLRTVARDSAPVARIGGDEFGMLLMNCPLEAARPFVDDFVRAVNEHEFGCKSQGVRVRVSVGLVELQATSGLSVGELMRAADAACFLARSKQLPVCIYSAADLPLALREEIPALVRLQSALCEGRFEVHGRLVTPAASQKKLSPGVEAYCVFRNETGVPISDIHMRADWQTHGLMSHVERWLVRNAMTALARGSLKLAADQAMYVELSEQTLAEDLFTGFLANCLDGAVFAPQQVCFIVDETSKPLDQGCAAKTVGALRSMGFNLASRSELIQSRQ